MEDSKFLPVSEWSDEDRPREKMLANGKKSLSNAELIAILLRSGVRGRSAVDVAKEVLAAAGNSLTTLSRMEYAQLNRVKGMALAKTTSLMAALELGWRMQSEITDRKTIAILSSQDLFNYMKSKLIDIDHEEFWAIYMNTHNQVIERQRISIGGITSTPVDLRILMRQALDCRAVRIAVVHNHPTGNLTPSKVDKELTYRLHQVCDWFDIQLIDHLIIGLTPQNEANYYSFNDDGKL